MRLDALDDLLTQRSHLTGLHNRGFGRVAHPVLDDFFRGGLEFLHEMLAHFRRGLQQILDAHLARSDARESFRRAERCAREHLRQNRGVLRLDDFRAITIHPVGVERAERLFFFGLRAVEKMQRALWLVKDLRRGVNRLCCA